MVLSRLPDGNHSRKRRLGVRGLVRLPSMWSRIKLKFLSVIFVNKMYDYCVTSRAAQERYGTLLDFCPFRRLHNRILWSGWWWWSRGRTQLVGQGGWRRNVQTPRLMGDNVAQRTSTSPAVVLFLTSMLLFHFRQRMMTICTRHGTRYMGRVPN